MAKIYWAGQSCFQISVSNSKENSADIVIDPFDKETGLKLPSLSADIILVTHDHHDHNNVEAIKPAQSGVDPFVINGPGEYEIKEVFVQGIPTSHDDQDGKDRGKSTIYVIETEDIKICHLGDFGQKQLSDEQLEKLEKIDVLMIPVGGKFTIDSAQAQRIISQIEPKMVIPMHYKIPGLKMDVDDVAKFMKTMGKASPTPVDKLVVKQSTLPKDGMEIVIMQP